MREIVMIPIEQLEHHPENPRKDLGDISELTESIRKNGIMQNLTVVKNHFVPDVYTVVIGNRRMEAARAAGLAEVPCVISEMDPRTQIATMLEENMQRNDLTVYEQAQGFQMMMDLGYSAKEISEKTGFSETTVGRRLKMAQLDKEIFAEAVGKQITIDDLDKLAKIENVEKRNELLKEYGENNFEWRVHHEICKQQADKVRGKVKQILEEAGIKQIPEKDRHYTYGKYDQLYRTTLEMDKWDGKSEFIPKTDGELFWLENGTDIQFYEKHKKQKAEERKKTPEEIEEEKKRELAWKTVERVAETSAELRKKFVEGLTVSPKNAMRMMQWLRVAITGAMISYDTPTLMLVKRFNIGGSTIPERIEQMGKILMEMPQKQWTELMLVMFEGDKDKKQMSFTSGGRYDFPKYDRKVRMEQCYEWLTEFGYQMSDEEIRMMSGKHECFGKGAAKNGET